MFNNKNLSEIWKEKTIDYLYLIYKDKYPKEKIVEYVNKQFDKYYRPVSAKTRNLYQYKEGIIPIDNILEDISSKESIMAANGSVFYNHKIEKSPIYDFLNESEELRAVFKKKMLEAGEKGDMRAKRAYDGQQYKHKERMNSAFGVQTQEGSIISNIDSASAITLQAREMISEMMWSIEKFLMGNMSFYDSNELASYFTYVINSSLDTTYLSYITYTPTIQDCIDKFNKSLFEMNNKKDFLESISYKKYIETFSKLSDLERIKYYYKDNLMGLISKNQKILDIFDRIYSNPDEFNDPYKIPESFKSDHDLLWGILKSFVLSGQLTTQRVYKYINRTRRCILLSDTDSIMICLDEIITEINKLLNNKYDIKKNLNNRFKIINMLSSFITKVCDIMCYTLAEACNVPESERFRLQMKNEFLFLRMITFANTKKQYAVYAALQEGKRVQPKDALMNIGSKLTSSNLVKEIKDEVDNILRNYMLEPTTINPLEVWNQYLKLENFIRNEILSGNKKYLIISKFKGQTKGYANIEGNDLHRGVTIWNRLYPEYKIDMGETVYKLKTIVHTKEDVEKYITDLEWKHKVLDLVFDEFGNHRREFKGLDYRSYGLSSLCINFGDGLPERIPEWIIPIIDVQSIIDLHLKVLKDLMVSIGLSLTTINSKRSKISTMINF